MRMIDLIHKKRNGAALAKEEIGFIIEGYTGGAIPDYQMSAFLMAVYFEGMSPEETAHLTDAMIHSGETIDLAEITGIKVDKHSTGGVGDKVSLVVGPLVAAAGVPVAKMSGRGLGHTGGTIDKLESIEGFRTELTNEQFVANVNEYKIAIIGQSGNLVPADKKMYALRDVTATVDSIPLIASSIMSKKIASGADAIVLDVKLGSGAFMKTLEDARKLAETMVGIGSSLGRRTVALISGMNEPLGREIGNAGEVAEALEVLRGQGAEDLTEVCLTVASYMTVLGGAYPDTDTARAALKELIASGAALHKFRQFIEGQDGDSRVADRPDLLPQAPYHREVLSREAGYVGSIEAESAGNAAMLLGAGRREKNDPIDHAVGITLLKKVGDAVAAGEPLCVLHSRTHETGDAEALILQAYVLQPSRTEPEPLIYAIVE